MFKVVVTVFNFTFFFYFFFLLLILTFKGILHNNSNKGEVEKIAIDGILSGLKEFYPQVHVKSFQLTSKTVHLNSKLVIDENIQAKQDEVNSVKQIEKNDLSNVNSKAKIIATLIPIDDESNLDLLSNKLQTDEMIHLIFDTLHHSDIGLKLSKLMKIPLISTQVNYNFTTNDFTSENSNVIWFKQPGYLLIESVRDIIDQLDLTKRHLRIFYTDEYGK